MENRILIIFFFITSVVFSQEISRERYIEMYSDEAINQMRKYNIPASITLAQGILESGNGNSELTKASNNHFGIKCHSDWSGETVYYDDDAKNECFRKYSSVSESYEDHSKFLLKKRYSKLFEYSIYDYKSWAKGLKKAGYATNPKYAKHLIKIIEDNTLYVFDEAIENKKKIYSGFSIGYVDVLTQSYFYFNSEKKYFVSSALSASLVDVSLMFGSGRLISNNLAVGGEIGILTESEDYFQLDLKANFGLVGHFFVPIKDKKLALKLGFTTTNAKQFMPRVSIGILK